MMIVIKNTYASQMGKTDLLREQQRIVFFFLYIWEDVNNSLYYLASLRRCPSQCPCGHIYYKYPHGEWTKFHNTGCYKNNAHFLQLKRINFLANCQTVGTITIKKSK